MQKSATAQPTDPLRSGQMRLVRSKDTKPEMVVRRALFSLGYRYRLHRSNLPGKPDLVFLKKRKAIFVNGCFWHRHPQCRRTRTPKTRLDYWVPKFSANVARDRRNQEELRALGWRFMVIWECELSDTDRLIRRILRFLER